MKNRILIACASVLLLFACKRENLETTFPENLPVLQEKTNPQSIDHSEPMSKADLDRLVIATLESRNDFHWEWMDVYTVWSAAQYGDHSIAIGYKPTGFGDITNSIHTIDLQSEKWKVVHDALIQLVLEQVNLNRSVPVSEKEIIVEDDPVLPIITFRLTDKNAIVKLYNLENVRYIEPLDYWPSADNDRSTSGCSASTTAINSADYSTTSPNALVPWNFNNVSIPGAWNSAQGQGITIGVIDAGISSTQPLLGIDFNNGDSNVGRIVSTAYTWGSSAFTTCTHGTSMSGTAVGPRNNLGAPMGVAYESSLYFIRACQDVVLDLSSEKTSVKNALIVLGNTASVKIISMSIGTPFSSGVLQDGVSYAYNNGKMIMAAAGTSYSWTSWWGVIYPAAYSQCYAITGVKENGSTCDSCHDGSQVDFTIPMERNTNSNRNSLALKTTGTGSSYIGGSSVATATAAGIAALVWSVNPNFTRTQVYNHLRNTSQFYPSIDGDHGYGNLNAAAAVAAAGS